MAPEEVVLVTGASGFLGQRIVPALIDLGYTVRALVRSTSNLKNLHLKGVELHYGDVTDIKTLAPAFAGVDFVIHAAAGTSGSDEQMQRVTVEGTRNMLEMSRISPLKKFVYISSCSVYGIGEYSDGQNVHEKSSLERFGQQRGMYSFSKIKAEQLVLTFMKQHDIPIVCLRPGTIFGRGGINYTPMLGFSKKNRFFIVIHRNEFLLPLVYIDNLVQAVLLSMTNACSNGQIYNVVDPYQIDKRQYMEQLIRKLHPGAKIFYFPYPVLSALVALQEKACKCLGCIPYMTMYRLLSSQRPVAYNTDKIIRELGWKPQITFADAVEKILLDKQ